MTHANNIVLEVCAYSLEAAIAAQAGGADRVELCANPSEGGVTPSYGDIVITRQNLTIRLCVLIRPRGGDFLYSPREFAAMKEDIELCNRLGVDGVSLGILLSDGKVDRERCGELVALAKPMSVTFHRAFDMTADPLTAMEEIIEIGCHRILSSGQANSAAQGADLIRKLVERAGERIVIMAGGGVRENNLAQLIAVTGAREFHTSARISVPSEMNFRNPRVSLGGGESEYDLIMVDQQQVAKMREIADQSSAMRRGSG
jgi:copper homeostasis protein